MNNFEKIKYTYLHRKALMYFIKEIELPRLTNRRFVKGGDSFLSEITDSKEPRVYQ